MAEIRAYRPDDLEALYAICLKTGASGQDATHLYSDPRAIGHIYAGPYGVLRPQSCYVIEDAHGVGGYIIGAADTRDFEQQQEAEWWPELRARYADPEGEPGSWTADQRMAYLMHHPARTPRRIADKYPAHLHIDLLPRFQGQGVGATMIAMFLKRMAELGAASLHLGVGPANARGVRFYEKYGFHEIERLPPPYNVIWFGISTS